LIALACAIPGIAMLIGGHFGAAALCLGLQLSVIGWPLASYWAVTVVREDEQERQYRAMVRRARG
jgi:TM2 domain-containing membrane protein YozV